MNLILPIISTITFIAVLLLQEWRLLLYFQQEEYSFSRFLKWSIRSFVSVNLQTFVLLVSFFYISLFLHSQSSWLVFGRVLAGGFTGYWIYHQIVAPKKINLVYTPRLMRIIYALIVFSAISRAGFDLVFWDKNIFNFWSVLLLDIVFIILSPAIIVLVNFLLSPVEMGVNRYYLRLAHEKIKRISPFVIGITGSFGKTSTKEIMAHILEGHKSVLATPKSYNTLMGVTKVINGSLQNGHEVFIVEMGAYRTGEIADICKLVKPTIGIITAIGAQHLERFKTIENVARAKFELISSLPAEGLAVFNADDAYSGDFVSHAPCNSCALVSLSGNIKADLIASNITAKENGIEFWVENRSSGEKELFVTELLGYHNVLNILYSTAVALHLGVNLHIIRDKVRGLKPVPHRLQLLKLPSGVNIIDDAYNSNPVGAKSALDALSLFSGRKIMVTPGLVELGSLQEAENYKIGQYASKICDLIVLVGRKQTSSIYAALTENGFNIQKVKIVESTREGIEYVNSISTTGDTVLYLNDLPDLYSE